MTDTVKIYLAAHPRRYLEIQDYAAQLTEAGYEVTSQWVQSGFKQAKEDWADLEKSDIFVEFSEEPFLIGVIVRRYPDATRYVELGIALAKNLWCIVVGPRENVFHCLPQVEQFDTWDAAFAELRRRSPAYTGPTSSQYQPAMALELEQR